MKKSSSRGLWLALGLLVVGALAVTLAVLFLVGGRDDASPPVGGAGGDATPSAASVATPVTIPAEPPSGSEDLPPERPPSQEAVASPPPETEEQGEEPARVAPPTPPAPRESAATPPTKTSHPESIERPTTSIVPIPAQPSVDLKCQGVSDACASLRAALEASFDRAGIAMAYPERAEILVTIFAEEVEARQESQFGTLFVVRTYSIEMTGESPRFGERVSMPPPETVTFDSRFGADKLAEHSRKVAGAVTEKIQAYWSSKK